MVVLLLILRLIMVVVRLVVTWLIIQLLEVAVDITEVVLVVLVRMDQEEVVLL